MNLVPVVRDVCLVGGGHSHALLLRRWAMRPIAGVRLTLVSSNVQTPYSGMLPGLIAGHYSVDDIHIDLLRLCSWAQVRFVEDTVTRIDLDKRQVNFSDRPGISFDVLSLDTGSTPDLSVPGAAEHVTPVKPVSDFYTRWCALQARLKESDSGDTSIAVVGSGAGGFELVTAMRHRLKDTSASCYWILRGDDAISGRPERVGRLAIAAAEAAGIHVVRQFDVVSVEPGKLTAADGRTVSLDEIIWCTAASGPGWPAAAGLDTDSRGFVSTNACLQSPSHPFVFATGDIGTQVQTPSSKAGVFAVRQAPVLFENIRRYLLMEKLTVYKPQKDFLSLMATGPRHGIASRGPLVVQGDWVWRWKDYIDQKFMDQFRNLPVRRMNASLAKLPNALNVSMASGESGVLGELGVSRESGGSGGSGGSGVPGVTGLSGVSGASGGSGVSDKPSVSGGARISSVSNDSVKPGVESAMRCRGCGAKVGSDVLQRVLDELGASLGQNKSLASWSPAGDTAVVDLPSTRFVQSVDQINAIVDDPYLLGRIAALHAISDVVTLDATVHSAQVLLTLPEASEEVVERDLRLLMRGVMSALTEENCALIGGHTTQGPDMSVGLAINASMSLKDDETSYESSSKVSVETSADTRVDIQAETQAETQADTQADTRADTRAEPWVEPWVEPRVEPRVGTQVDTSDDEPTILHIRSGDVLVLTKPLGTGTLFAGLMRTLARGEDINAAVASMLVSNRTSAEILRAHGSVAMTDVTGFGLLGHLQRLRQGLHLQGISSVSEKVDPAPDNDALIPGATITLDQVPLFHGALALSEQGCRSSLWQQNSVAFADVVVDPACDADRVALLVDPQTSGGLLAIVPEATAQPCIEALHTAGITHATIIGQLDNSGTLRIVPASKIL